MISRLLHTLTDAAASRRGKFATLAIWLVAVIALVGMAPRLASLYDNTSTLAIPSGADSQVAQRLLLETFPQARGTPAILVFSDRTGLSADDRAHIQRISQWLTSGQQPASVRQVVSVWTVPQAASQLVSSDGTTMTLIATLDGSTADAAFSESVKTIRAYANTAVAGTPLQAHLTGPAGISTDAGTIFASTDLPLLLATVGLVLVLLILVYRSPILALLPLVGVGWALQIVDAVLGFAAQGGLFGVSQQATSIMTVLLFGAGADYSIFIASRFREELRHTRDKHDAMRTTMRAVGEAIASSASTVILAMLLLIAAALFLYSSLGPTLAIAIAVMLLAGLTLVPALLTILGRAAYWPLIPRYDPGAAAAAAPHPRERGFWSALGHWTARHRVVAVGGSLLFLGILALGNLGLQPTYNLLTSFREQTDSSAGYALLHQHFPAGTLAPTTVLIQLRGATPDAYQQLVALDAITTALADTPGVATVRGPTRPDGNALAPAALQAAIAQLPPTVRDAIRAGAPPTACRGPACPPPDPQRAKVIGLFAASTRYISSDNSTIQLSVVLQDDPYSLAAINRIAPLRQTLARALDAAGLGPSDATSATVAIAGQTSLLADTKAYNQRDMLLIVPAVLLLVGIVLALLLRSLIAPLYLLGAVTFNFLAALGVCGFFFVRIEGQDGYNYAIPLYTFIFLVALGADYTIYLMSRVREEARRHGLAAGVPLAVGRTGGVITSAGLILAGTFAVLTTLPINILYQLGICVAVGVLLDTFVVRGLLVPGLVLLLGRWNWWPGKLASHADAAATIATHALPPTPPTSEG